MPTHCVTLWIGRSLGPIERACLASALRHGHQVALYCYRAPDGIPRGVEVRDAAKILPESAIIRHRTGSPSLFSNWFRYELLRRGLGTWIDCDIYFVKPLEDTSPLLFGNQDEGVIGTGVLRLPPESPLLPDLIDLFRERRVPPWLPLRARLAALWRLVWHGKTGISEMPWGVAGPQALTALAQEHRLAQHALPTDVFCPVSWREAEWVFDPGATLAERVSPRTVSVHLWNEMLRRRTCRNAAKGSFMRQLMEEAQAA